MIERRSRNTRWLLFLCAASACSRSEPSKPPANVEPTPPARRKAPLRQPRPHETIDIPGGAFLAGSVPGEAGRLPELEPRSKTIELGPFAIDRLPYPNVPDAPAKTNVTRAEAERLCVESGARLCTELEWERACKGPGNDTFVTGSQWDPACAENPLRCASGFDVLGMGVVVREWVRGSVTGENQKLMAVTRGVPAKSDHSPRCSLRRTEEADARSADLGFRCCRGAPNAALVTTPKLEEPFDKTSLPAKQLQELLAGNPLTANLAKELVYFREPDAAETVVQRGPKKDRMGFSFTVAPLIWRPVAGSEYLLVTARSGKDTSFVLAYYVLGDGKYELASSFVMKDEVGPVAIAYSPSIRPRVHFSSCWGCTGESGRVLYRDFDTVSIVQP